MLTSVVMTEAREGRITKEDYSEYIAGILKDEVKTCRAVSAIAAAKIAEVYTAFPDLKTKKSQ